MRSLLRRLAVAVLGAAAWLAAAAEPAPESAPVLVEVERSGERWTATFRLPADSPAWLFLRSPVAEVGRRPVRAQSWTVETEGVRLERRGHHDLLVAAPGRAVPRIVRIGFRAFPGRVVSDYDPAIVFTDGSVALYSEQFDAVPLAAADSADALPPDLDSAGLPAQASRVTFRDAGGPVLHLGTRRPQAVVEDDSGSYILFGPARGVTTGALTLVVDPALPAWLGDSLRRDTPAILDLYARAMGPPPGRTPTILVGWAGPTDLFSIGGGVLPGQIVMRFEGAALTAPNPETARTNLWFIAHEAAHFWLGQAVSYESPRDGWITEGGADLLAIRAISAIDPGYDPRPRLQQAIDDCVALSRGRGIGSALERDEHRAYYACGAVFALVAEAATRRPYADFVRALIEANPDRVVTRAEWLAALTHASGGPGLARDIELLVAAGAEDPAVIIASLFARAGIRHRRPAAGGLLLP